MDIIRGAVERAESGEITREGAWRTIKDVLREVERHDPPAAGSDAGDGGD
jgi:hypothetical protein